MTGRLIAVVGPSGVGKDSLMQALAAADQTTICARRVITRAADAGGEAFDAVDKTVFDDMVAKGHFLLHWGAYGLSYGVPVQVKEELHAGRSVLVNLSRSVLLDAQKKVPDLIVLSLVASREVLAERLSLRGREDKADRARRLDRAVLPLPEGLACVYEVDNSGPLSETVAECRALLHPERV
ncbi:phosphonate metabolism protein/1,5-bisphosphokinase (PRPP-forming) PhnN [Thalassococcus sp. S3]|uniref:phosphonate metabolism protein/1,5-bisphosphokinase (PRPP-forming) PhnN n=1 Tax=Thalassococcus sp. S3 TaxID=2017482 RepID=UPI00102427EE|nr:phosphonate metabolism protein/1,5-bisphosphokinase (PRPP-forming) PhnN [Thalassococcus sp. S3]QBF30660.1 phosphonate metabolism protein/1,5-bisphosphokinase (PRPP-forming) PhnN [Thalassococcus sp. S3]